MKQEYKVYDQRGELVGEYEGESPAECVANAINDGGGSARPVSHSAVYCQNTNMYDGEWHVEYDRFPERSVVQVRQKCWRHPITMSGVMSSLESVKDASKHERDVRRAVVSLIGANTLESRGMAVKLARYLKEETDFDVPNEVWDYFESRSY